MSFSSKHPEDFLLQTEEKLVSVGFADVSRSLEENEL